ncbi:MAG: hypothetical protein ACRD3Q_15485 [Terriglobales bacterium]
MPADTTMRVGRGQSWVTRWTSAQYAALSPVTDSVPFFRTTTELSPNQRDYIWDGRTGREQGALSLPPGVFTGAYISVAGVVNYPFEVDPLHYIHFCGPNQDCTYEWLDTNHPNWIVRTHDQATPAWFFNAQNFVPLDISNPIVQNFLLVNEIGPLIGYGFQGISVDNVNERNLFDLEGVCSASIPLDSSGNPVGDCTSNGGIWTQLYQPPSTLPDPSYDDGAYTTDRVAWLKAITAYAHQLGAAVAANIYYETRNLNHKAAHDQAYKALINSVDIWAYEPGFTGTFVPSPCLVGGAQSYSRIAGDLAAGANTVTLANDNARYFTNGSEISIPGAGPNGNVYVGNAVGAPQGDTITIQPSTGTAVASGTLIYEGGPQYGMVGTQWINLVNFINGLNLSNSIATYQENSICPIGTDPQVSRPVVEWAIGSNLMTKPAANAHSYVEMFFANGDGTDGAAYDTDEEPGGDWPEWHWRHGKALDPVPVLTNGVYSRRFQHGMVVCNPTADPLSFYFGTAVYHSFTNQTYTGTQSIAGPSCVMLQTGP